MRLGINGRFLAARLTGVQRVAHGLCNELYGRSDVTLFVPANARVPEPPEYVRVVRGVMRGQPWEQLELPRAAADIDLLLHPANSLPFAGGPHAIVLHDVLALSHPQWFSHKYVLWHRHVVRPAVARARLVFTFSTWAAREIARTCSIPESRIQLIPQGLEPFVAPARQADVQAALARFGITQPYLLAVGLGDPRKNITWLTRVVADVRRSHRGVFLVAVGGHSSHVHAQPQVLPEWVITPGDVSDEALRALYTGALALCFPSLEEGFGRPPLEALACGTPALVGQYGAARAVLGDTVPILPFDVAVWRHAIAELIERPDYRRELVQRASVLLADCSWTACAERVLAACAESVSQSSEVSA